MIEADYWWDMLLWRGKIRQLQKDLIEVEAAIREVQRAQDEFEKAVQTVSGTAAGVAGTDPETSGLREEDQGRQAVMAKTPRQIVLDVHIPGMKAAIWEALAVAWEDGYREGNGDGGVLTFDLSHNPFREADDE